MGRVNPLARVPVLELDGGERLIDSTAILDHLDECVGPERALTPASGPARRAVATCAVLQQQAESAAGQRSVSPVPTPPVQIITAERPARASGRVAPRESGGVSSRVGPGTGAPAARLAQRATGGWRRHPPVAASYACASCSTSRSA